MKEFGYLWRKILYVVNIIPYEQTEWIANIVRNILLKDFQLLFVWNLLIYFNMNLLNQ